MSAVDVAYFAIWMVILQVRILRNRSGKALDQQKC